MNNADLKKSEMCEIITESWKYGYNKCEICEQ